jgi:uncharacterized protein
MPALTVSAAASGLLMMPLVPTSARRNSRLRRYAARVAASPTVTDNPGAERFEAMVDGQLAGAAYYERRGERVVFVHTEVDEAFEGHGVGSALASGALDAVRARGERAVAVCPFIAAYIDRHPEYDDMVDRGPLDATM